jgi:hypothetical protein
MTRRRITVSADVPAPPAAVYGLIADYRHGHPRILPPKYFRNLEVERGGRGAGTVFRFEMWMFGTTRVARGEVTEPVPGRVLSEKYLDDETVTTFTVEPSPDVASTRVTIATDLRGRPGLVGHLERLVATRLLPRIYREELALLSAVAAGREA